MSMSNPHDTDPRRSDLPSRPDLEAPRGGGSMWPWLAGLVAILVILGLAFGYHQTEQASDNQSSAPTTTGAAPSAPRPPAPPANPGGNASQPTPAMPTPAMPAPAPTPNEKPR
jgi:hypothetical protein